VKTILIIEPHANLRRLYEDALSRLGYNILTAWHPRQAEQKIDLGQPDLIIVDPPSGVCGETKSWTGVFGRENLPPIILNAGAGDSISALSPSRPHLSLCKSSEIECLTEAVSRVLARH